MDFFTSLTFEESLMKKHSLTAIYVFSVAWTFAAGFSTRIVSLFASIDDSSG